MASPGLTPGQRLPAFHGEDSVCSPTVLQRLKHLVAPHVDSYNYFLEHGLETALADLPPMHQQLGEDVHFQMKIHSVTIQQPLKHEDLTSTDRLTPRECRERHISYTGSMEAVVAVNMNDGEQLSVRVKLGEMPVMVQSLKCHLSSCDPKELLQMQEEGSENGGYFIINGIERVVRLLQVPRRNYATAIERSSFKNRGKAYSDKGVTMRCVRPDQSSVTITLHYLTNGGAMLKFSLLKQEMLLPAVLVAKALVPISDKELFDRIVQGDTGNTFLTTRLELLLRDFSAKRLLTMEQCRAHLGSLLRSFLPLTDSTSDADAGKFLLERFICVHVAGCRQKCDVLLHMMRKLYSFAQGLCAADNADALMNHEILLPGHLMTMIVKEKLEEALKNVKMSIDRDYQYKRAHTLNEIRKVSFFQKHFDRHAGPLGSKIVGFLSSGNIISSSGLDLMQVSGYTIVAERLNIFRYMSHFQSVHRGQFFTTMKTTTVRKLLPESWGFLCPVHTPDGSPCGLLNHLARECCIMAYPPHTRMPTTPLGSVPVTAPLLPWSGVVQLLASLGMMVCGIGMADGQGIATDDFLSVLLDGVVVGAVRSALAAGLVKQLRALKATRTMLSLPPHHTGTLDPTLEIAHLPLLPDQRRGAAYPGIYLHTQPGRMLRPVLHLGVRRIEWIGPMEQVHMDIACLREDCRAETTHMELSPDAMLSHIAALTPFSDYNQSPRNMYQCQMGKQSMGTPAHAIKRRTDNKLFRLQSPQSPIVQTQAYRDYGMDEYPQGINAVVAVVAYTGYDMEDAMIISKSSFERGFGNGCVVKTKVIDLEEEEKSRTTPEGRPELVFGNVRAGGGSEKVHEELDFDGLPLEGERIQPSQALCCMLDTVTGQTHAVTHKESEACFVDTVRVLGGPTGKRGCRRVSLTLRYPRRPVIGDKFSSRHGQKGTLSVLWPQENMPFSESGMSPDVLINPHAFPSRMTIGMLIESMAGKAGAIHGHFQDATPFTFHEKARAIDHLGEQLRAAGYHYYGSEPLYSGLSGELMQCDIFMGLVYYQRLRHMVSDKSQVRSTGAVVHTTRQPVKGRKKHGGIRLGEMERDALLSHGASFCLHDRLMGSSDGHVAYCCAKCGGMLGVRAASPQVSSSSSASAAASSSSSSQLRGRASFGYGAGMGGAVRSVERCSSCESSEHVRPVNLPYIYRYLMNELAGMGIKLTLTLST